MLSNAYFLAKFRFDTAENEPAKNLQNFRKVHFRKMHFSKNAFSKRGAHLADEVRSDVRALREDPGADADLEADDGAAGAEAAERHGVGDDEHQPAYIFPLFGGRHV